MIIILFSEEVGAVFRGWLFFFLVLTFPLSPPSCFELKSTDSLRGGCGKGVACELRHGGVRDGRSNGESLPPMGFLEIPHSCSIVDNSLSWIITFLQTVEKIILLHT